MTTKSSPIELRFFAIAHFILIGLAALAITVVIVCGAMMLSNLHFNKTSIHIKTPSYDDLIRKESEVTDEKSITDNPSKQISSQGLQGQELDPYIRGMMNSSAIFEQTFNQRGGLLESGLRTFIEDEMNKIVADFPDQKHELQIEYVKGLDDLLKQVSQKAKQGLGLSEFSEKVQNAGMLSSYIEWYTKQFEDHVDSEERRISDEKQKSDQDIFVRYVQAGVVVGGLFIFIVCVLMLVLFRIERNTREKETDLI